MIKSAGEILVSILEDANIDQVFGMPGGAVLNIINEFAKERSTINCTLARHEGGAACMANAYARLTGKPALLIGQGLWIGTNAGFGIVESYLSGVPILIVTDISDWSSLSLFGTYQNSSGNYGSIDLPSIMKSMTKYVTTAFNISDFAHGIQQAIRHSTTGKPGPACVITDFRTTLNSIDDSEMFPKLYRLNSFAKTSLPCISEQDAEKVADILIDAENPVMIIGNGIHNSKAYNEVCEIAELLGMPVATSYMGKSAIPETNILALGTAGGIAGQKIANIRIKNADVIFAVGTGLSPENTKYLQTSFINPEKQKIIQIDIEPLHIGWTFPLAIGISSDAKLALSKIIRIVKEKVKTNQLKIDLPKRLADLKREKELYKYYFDDELFSNEFPIVPERFIRELNDIMSENDLLILDAGNNRMWATHNFKSKNFGQVIAPGGAAGIGYAPPAAIGAKVADIKNGEERKVVALVGDAGMLMHLYVFEMVKHYNLSIIFIILNNGRMGTVADNQPQDKKIMTDYPQIDFTSIASGFGFNSYKIEKSDDIRPVLEKAFKCRSSTVVEVIVKQKSHTVLKQ